MRAVHNLTAASKRKGGEAARARGAPLSLPTRLLAVAVPAAAASASASLHQPCRFYAQLHNTQQHVKEARRIRREGCGAAPFSHARSLHAAAAPSSSPSASPTAAAPAAPAAPCPSYSGRAVLLDGRATSSLILDDISLAVRTLQHSGRAIRSPGLAVLLANSSRDSLRYVESKAQVAQRLGFESHTIKFDESTVTNEDLLSTISHLNGDPSIDGILVQLPLPPQIDVDRILNAVRPAKDVDGFHRSNVASLSLLAAREGEEVETIKYQSWEERVKDEEKMKQEANRLKATNTVYHVPCTPKGCLELLDHYHVPLAGRHVVVLGRSAAVGLPLTLLLLNRCATVTNIDQLTDKEKAKSICQTADVVIAAVGQPEYIRGDWLKPGAAVIDVGINFVPRSSPSSSSSSSSSSSPYPENPADAEDGLRLVGDVCFSECESVAGFLTPVPGGVGPMTVAMLMDNTLRSFISTLQK